MIWAVLAYYVISTSIVFYTMFTDVDYHRDTGIGKLLAVIFVILMGWCIGVMYVIDEYSARKRKTPEAKEFDRTRKTISKFSNKEILVALQKTYPEEFL